MESYRAMYGARECIAYPVPDAKFGHRGYRYHYFHVSIVLAEDPAWPLELPLVHRDALTFIGTPPPVKE